MHKLLSLVLSVSILVSSMTPALAQARVGRGVVKGMRRSVTLANRRALSARVTTQVNRQIAQSALAPNMLQNRILTGNVTGVASQILQKPAVLRAPALRNEFVSLSLIPGAVTPAQRAQAVKTYKTQLKNTQEILSKTSSLNTFLNWAKETPNAEHVVAVRNILADASALGLVGTKEDASILLDFYKQTQGTVFEDTAALIAARGLLRMQGYEELGTLFALGANEETLAGTAAYIRVKELPVEIPSSFQVDNSKAADERLAAFLGVGFVPNRLHADTSLTATEKWVNLKAPVPAQQGNPVAQKTAAQTPVATQTAPAAPAQKTSARSGVLYSGIPVFAVTDALERFGTWARRQLHQRASDEGPLEEPGLHESKVRPVFAEVDVPSKASVGGDLIGVEDIQEVPVAVDGFKLTVTGEDNVEHILRNVDLTVSNTLKNFSPEYNRLALDKNYIFELRNQTLPNKRPDHFYFTLNTQNGELNTLLEGIRKLNLTRPMRLKIQRTSAPKKVITLPVYDKNLQEPPVIMAEVDTSLISGIKDPEKGHIWTYNGGLFFRSPEGEITPLENAFVRLPKAESKYWTQVLAMYPQASFKLGVFSTMEKMVPVTYLVPSLQIGLGKTLAPEMHDTFGIEKDTASNIMLGINNVLPALMIFVHPLMKQYGEAAVFRVGSAMFTLGGLTALATGLYGHVGGGEVTSLQLAGFVVSSILIALGTNVTRFVQNLLMSANRGIVPQASSFEKEQTMASTIPVTYDRKHLTKRAWEVLTKKNSKSLRDVIYYQRGAMFKNLGTMLFLSFPMLANFVGKLAGVDLGLDFSASYVPYTLYSLYTLRQVYKTRYKDAFPMNMTVLSNNLQDLQNTAALKIHTIKPEELSAQNPELMSVAKQLKGAIDALVPVESRQTKTTINTLTAKHEAEVGQEIEQLLGLSDRTPAQAAQARQALQQAFDILGRRDVKWWKVAKMKGLPASLGAMTLATFGELGFSNGLAFAMRDMGLEGTAATGVVGLLLYGCMFGWRIVGNILSQRMSGGSMYALSSAASILGPIMASLAVPMGNISLLVAGTVTACFGISNFFSQMYEYMIGLYPKYKREIALLINFTMPLAALPVGAMKSGAFEAIPGLDIAICGAALAASVALTPGMLANSSMVQAAKYGWQQLKAKVSKFFRRGNNLPPAAELPAN